jgi:uncharacterized protein YndB with AHSA1/START domain
MPATTTAAIEREVHIAASPETVYSFFVDADQFVRWMGRKAEIDARPGGVIRLDYNGFDIMRGTIVEFEPNRRMVITWGWETLGDATQPGQSRVEVTLTPEAGGTRLRLVHSGLSDVDAASHGAGWDHFLETLKEQASGAAAPVQPALSEGEEFASRLNTQLVHLRWAVEACPTDHWANATANDGRQANQVAQHVVGHLGLVGFVQAVARGERAPQADFTGEMLAQFNARAAHEALSVTQGDVLAALRSEGPKAVDAMKALTSADLDRSQSIAFAGGADMSARQLVEGPILHDIEEHVKFIRSVM